MGVDGLNSCSSSSSSSSSSSRMRYLVKTQDMVIGSSFMVMLVYCDGVIQARIGGWCVCVWKGSQSYLYSNEPCCFCATARLRAGFEHDAGLEI